MNYELITFLAGWKEFNPFRIVLIILVSLVWLLCFSSLFSKDKRKTRVGYRNVFKAKLLRLGFIEKRKHQRIVFPMAVKYRIIVPGQSEERPFLTGNAKNLSESGILISTNEDISAGDDIEIRLNIHGFNEPISVIGSVVRKEKDAIDKTHSVGVLFKKIENISGAEFSELIRRSL